MNLQSRPFQFSNTKILALFTLLVILADELSKIIAQKSLAVSCNRGIAFGFGTEGKVMSIIALILVLWFLVKAKEDVRKIGLTLIFAGGLANLVDRVVSGCVRDFIAIWIFPTFNLSDIAITFGVVVTLYALVINERKGLAKSDEHNF